MSISEPYLLSSYGTYMPLKNKPVKKSWVFASHQQISSSSDGYVTVAASTDGVHILDLSTLHPAISHTLGHSVTFSCPAVSRYTVEDGARICTTFAAIDLTHSVSMDRRGPTVWAWRDKLSTTLDNSSKERTSALAPHPISRMCTSDDMLSSLILISPTADITVMDASSLTVLSFRKQQESCKLIESFIFPRKLCTFVPSRPGVIAVLFYAIGTETHVEVLAISEEEGVVDLGKCSTTIMCNKLCNVTCSTSGYIGVLTTASSWNSYQLACSPSVTITQAGPSCQFTSISASRSKIPLLSLNTSHVLLASLSSANPPSITILLLDLQYCIVLAEYTVPVPSTLLDQGIVMTLVNATTTSALLVLSPPASNMTSCRSSILVIPYTVPPTSTLSGALGQGRDNSLTPKWLLLPTSMRAATKASPKQRKFLAALLKAQKTNDYREAITIWGKMVWPKDLRKQFVEETLELVLPGCEEGKDINRQILECFLEKGMLRREHFKGGLLQGVANAGRWDQLDKVLKGVCDISEDDIIEVLHLVIKHHRIAFPTDPNAMKVDPSTRASEGYLSAYLASCTLHPASPTPLRLAIRTHLQDTEDLFIVLTLLEGWIRIWANADLKLMPLTRVVKNEFGVEVWVESKMVEHLKKIPPYHLVLSFLQAVLDAQWLTLLSYPPSHSILRTLLSHMEPQISSIETAEALRGPLEPFARTHERMLREGREGKKTEDGVDWRKRWKEKETNIQGAIGVYRLEELVL